MKILSYLNVSNPLNLEADSGFVFQSLLFKSILYYYPDTKIFFICTPKTPFIDDRVQNVPLLNDYCNKYSVRFDFPWSLFKQKLSFLNNIDIALINQPELVSNFRALFSVVNNQKVKIVSYFHYFPIEDYSQSEKPNFETPINHNNLAESIFMRQIDAISSSDLCLTCSRFSIDFFLKNAQLYNKNLRHIFNKKFVNINPPISIDQTQENKTNSRYKKKTLIYNHRLYKHYGTEEIFKWLNDLYQQRKDFQVIVTDPTGKRTKERKLLNKDVDIFKNYLKNLPFVKIRHIKNRDEYYKTLWKSYLGLGPLKPSALWSMSVVDLMACMKPVLAPNCACFPEMLENRSNLIFTNKNEFLEKINRLLDDKDLYSSEQTACYNLALKYSDKTVAQKFMDSFMSLQS